MEHIRDILIKMGYLPDEKQLKEYIKRINDLEYQTLEFMKITGFTLEQFKQLYLSGTIKLVPGNDSIKYISEIHRAIKTYGLQNAINIIMMEKPNTAVEALELQRLKEVLNNEKCRKKVIK